MKKRLPKLIRLIVLGGSSLLLLMVAVSISGAENVLHRLVNFSPASLAGILILLIANLFQVTFRLWRILTQLGLPLPWNIAFRASMSGHIAGLFVMSLFGQVFGRQAVLRRFGLRPVVIATLTAYERVLLALISGVLGGFGVIFLLGPSIVAEFIGRVPITEMVLVVMGGAVLSIGLGRSRFEARLASRIRTWSAFSCLVESATLTLISQLMMMGSFVVGIEEIQPGIDMVSLFAAAAVISFAASIPVTVNGWGIRELASVFVLGRLGISAADAVAVSVLIGFCSTIVIVLMSPFAFKGKTVRDPSVGEPLPMGKHSYEFEKASAWILAMAVAVLVFFQVHVELPGSLGVINLNIADPFAILALAALSSHALSVRRVLVWRVHNFNVILALISLVLILAFLRGLLEVGVTQWALAGRVFGWLVLLGYISAGYLMVVYAGAHGLRRISETMIATGVVVVVLQVILRLLVQGGWVKDIALTANFEGYAANRNAFVFQMLVCVALVLGYSSVRSRHRTVGAVNTFVSNRVVRIFSSNLFPSLLGVLLLGLIFSGSRAGWLVITVVLLAAWVARIAERRVIARGLLFTIGFWGLIMIGSAIRIDTMQSAISAGTSDREHWESMIRALDMWLESPVLGAGLGVFIEKSSLWFGHPVVIHSTPLWILAEFGMVGAGVFGWGFLSLVRSTFEFQTMRPGCRTLAMLLLAFAGFCLAHEIFYQRIFWLVLGLTLAYPGKSPRCLAEHRSHEMLMVFRKQVLVSPTDDAGRDGRVTTMTDHTTGTRISCA